MPSELQDGILTEAWYILKPRSSKDEVSGEIRVSLTYHSEDSITKQKRLEKENYSKDVDDRVEKRKKTVARSNIARWIHSIEAGEIATEWTDAAIELYEWIIEDSG